jgi:hypothetical protein
VIAAHPLDKYLNPDMKRGAQDVDITDKDFRAREERLQGLHDKELFSKEEGVDKYGYPINTYTGIVSNNPKDLKACFHHDVEVLNT